MLGDETAIQPEVGSAREIGIVEAIMAQPRLAEAIGRGPAAVIRASADLGQDALFPFAATLEVNSSDAAAALAAVEAMGNGFNVIVVHNALQFLIETRQFLAACFARLSIGGVLIVTTPHQFLYERKLRLPSRRNASHRRFFTPNTLLAEIEEAIDPCDYRVRYLADCDDGYDYRAGIGDAPDGAQDIVVALEKMATPPWRGELQRDELWARAPTQPARFLPVDREAPALVRTFAPDRRAIRRVIIVKLDHRGDFLMAGQAFGILRDAFADAEITLVCGSWNVAEARKLGTFDEVVALDFFPEDDSARQQMPLREVVIAGFAERMRGERYDLAIDLRLYSDTREVLRAISARNYAGFDRYDAFPWLTIRLNTPSPTDDDNAEAVFIAAEHFSTEGCRHLGYEIRAEKALGANAPTLVWGPYRPLKPGHYRLECLIEPLGADFDLPFDIATRAGSEILAMGALRVSRLGYPKFLLEVERYYDSFELRILARRGGETPRFRFFGLRLVRESVMRGQHQSEAMTLLARLIEMRLRDAFAVETL